MSQAFRSVVLKGEATITLRRDTISKAPNRSRARALIRDDAAPLFAGLKARRRALAEAARVPAYVIFPDRTLIEMAETRPSDLDGMARINGVGAKKLESYGAMFLEVINGDAPAPDHPARRKLAGRETGAVYDRLMAAQADLARGGDGTGKPMSCSARLLARVAEARPTSLGDIERLLGSRHTERFGEAFLEVIAED